jgi:hypothetical protein
MLKKTKGASTDTDNIGGFFYGFNDMFKNISVIFYG